MSTTKWFAPLLVCAALVAAGCTPSASGPATGSANSISELDYYTDAEGSAAWQQNLDSCSRQTGVTIRRQQVPTDQLLPKVLQAAGSHALPNLLMTDNPTVQQIAATGALTPVTDYGIATDGYYDSIIQAGTYQGKVYGLAPGVNGLALFYNKDAFAAAGVQPPSTWDDLKTAAAKLTGNGRYGIAFSAVPSEEGTWQFLPFFWSNGGDLSRVDSPQGVAALQFETDLVTSGSASRSVLSWKQDDVTNQFVAGNAAMMINGSWNLNKLDANSSLHYGIVPIPTPRPGAKPSVALGGEVGSVPVTNPDGQQAAGKVLSCLLSDQNMLTWDTAHSLVPAKTTVARRYGQQYPAMQSFIDEVATAKSRTAQLGERYQPLSTALGTAIQSALTGRQAPAQALQQAAKAVG